MESKKIKRLDIRLAVAGDVCRIAGMSRDMVEQGLGWRWTPDRVLKNIRDINTNVVVACENQQILGFGIMKYKQEEAHLFLLAVCDSYRRKGIATTLMSWLERTVLTAGIGSIYLEVRVINKQARSFYRKLGYREIRKIRGYYRGKEDAVVIAKDLWDVAIA